MAGALCMSGVFGIPMAFLGWVWLANKVGGDK